MPETSLPTVWQSPDSTQYAALSFLARYRGDTLRAYSQDLRAFLRWCDERGLRPLQAQRPHLELYLRWMEQQGYAAATIGRRFTTVAGFYRYAVLDGHCPSDPAVAVTRPKVPWEGQRRNVLHPLGVRRSADHRPPRRTELARAGRAARDDRSADRRGHPGQRHRPPQPSRLRTAHDHGQGRQAGADPLPVPVLRAVRDATAGRSSSPVLLNSHGARHSPAAATGRLRRLATAVGLSQKPSPHTLRRTFCTAGLVSGVPSRDMQYAMQHADSRTTLRYDMVCANLDRHAAHAVAAYLAGMSAD